MEKACFYANKIYANNRIFYISDAKLNRDNCLYPFYLLKKTFLEKGIDLSTQDIIAPNDAIFTLYYDVPGKLSQISPADKSYLMIYETELIRPYDWIVKNHLPFSKIFTWHDDFIDNKKYFKFCYPNDIKIHFKIGDSSSRNKLCTLIAGNKKNTHPNELYSKRVRAIQWFEKNRPKDFDYYGIGWDNVVFPNDLLIGKILNRLKLKQTTTPRYVGPVKSKIETLKQYKFCICYENCFGFPGYITEKIFDCFFAGTIPIYLGAPNINDYIPGNCYIDATSFKNEAELYEYIINFKQHEAYQHNIAEFLKSDKAKIFSNEAFVENIIQTIL